MHSGSFIANSSNIQQLDDFRRDVREKVYSRFENSKTVLQQAKEKDNHLNFYQSILRRSISPKSPSRPSTQFSPHQRQSPILLKSSNSRQSPSRLSFQRSSLDLGKSNSSMLSYPKKNLQEIVSVNRIIDLQKAIRNMNYNASENYMNELKKLAKLVLNE